MGASHRSVRMMRGAAFLVVTLALSNVSFCKKKPRDKGMDISQLDLNITDPSVLASKNVDTLACRQKFDFSSGSSVAIESPSSIRVLVGEHDTTDSVADIRTISAITDHP